MTPEDFKNNLSALIRQRGMTEGGLSKKIGRHESALRKMLDNDKQWPRLDTAIALAAELQCSLDTLVFGPSAVNPLMDALAALPEADRAYVAALIARLRSQQGSEQPG